MCHWVWRYGQDSALSVLQDPCPWDKGDSIFRAFVFSRALRQLSPCHSDPRHFHGAVIYKGIWRYYPMGATSFLRATWDWAPTLHTQLEGSREERKDVTRTGGMEGSLQDPTGIPFPLIVSEASQADGAQLPCWWLSRGAGWVGCGWGLWGLSLGFCGPQRPPDGGAGDTDLCVLDHAVLCLLLQGPLGVNPVGLRSLTLEVKHHRWVVGFFPGSLLHCAIFHLHLPRLHRVCPKWPRWQLQIRIAELPLLSSLTRGPEWLWILTSFDPSVSANHPPGQQRASPQQKQQKCQQGEEYLEPQAVTWL